MRRRPLSNAVNFPVNLVAAEDAKIFEGHLKKITPKKLFAIAQLLDLKRQTILDKIPVGTKASFAVFPSVPNATLFLGEEDLRQAPDGIFREFADAMKNACAFKGKERALHVKSLVDFIGRLRHAVLQATQRQYEVGFQKNHIVVVKRSVRGNLKIGDRTYPLLRSYGQSKSAECGFTNETLVKLARAGLNGASLDDIAEKSKKPMAAMTSRYFDTLGYPFLDCVMDSNQKFYLLDYSQASHWQKHLEIVALTAVKNGHWRRGVSRAERHACRTFEYAKAAVPIAHIETASVATGPGG
jgi:hypothetical protein